MIFDARYKGEKGPSQWVTSDVERRQVFIDDPMAGIDISVNFDWNMIKAFGRIYKKENIAKISPNVRIGIFSGDMDPIGGTKSSKAKKLLRRYHKAGLNAEIHIYKDARHELHNEKCRDEYFRDIVGFFDSAISAAEPAVV